jgi:hypothetical protein
MDKIRVQFHQIVPFAICFGVFAAMSLIGSYARGTERTDASEHKIVDHAREFSRGNPKKHSSVLAGANFNSHGGVALYATALKKITKGSSSNISLEATQQPGNLSELRDAGNIHLIASPDGSASKQRSTGDENEISPTPDDYGTFWKPVRIGAGGFITGIDITSDGTAVIRTDTYGAYLWDTNTARWVQLVNAASMPPDDLSVDRNSGVYEIRIAPNDSNRIYMMYRGMIYRTEDK